VLVGKTQTLMSR